MNEQRKDLITLLLFFEAAGHLQDVIPKMRKDGIYPPQTDAQFLAVENVIIPELSRRQREIIEQRKPKFGELIIPGRE